jgi:hypothetical protein
MESSHSTVLLFIHISVASMCSIDAFGLDGEPQEHGDVTIEVISLICTHLYLTVSRLMKNQLPGGCHTSDDEAKRQESTCTLNKA